MRNVHNMTTLEQGQINVTLWYIIRSLFDITLQSHRAKSVCLEVYHFLDKLFLLEKGSGSKRVLKEFKSHKVEPLWNLSL